jgi:hypothetical protein
MASKAVILEEERRRRLVVMSEEESLYMKLKRFEDLVMMVFSPMAPSFLCHTEKGGKHIYFTVLGAMGKTVTVYVEGPPIKKKYALMNTITHEVSYSDEFTTDPSKRYVLIVDVAEQNLIK